MPACSQLGVPCCAAPLARTASHPRHPCPPANPPLLSLHCPALRCPALQVFLGTLRDSEVERVNDKVGQAVIETCLAMTIFREDITASFLT